LTGHLFPSTVGSLDINFDEGREAQLEKLAVGADAKNKAASSTPQLTDTPTNNLIQDAALFFRQHSSSSTPQLTDIQTNNLIQVREAKLEK